MTIDPRILETARAELTPPQFIAWKLHTDGNSTRSIAYALDLSRTTITDRIDAAWRTLRKHGVLVTPDGTPYLEEHTTA
jgi:DNA-binding NarL/FixJ family response regulator